jgi:hypothetical protein
MCHFSNTSLLVNTPPFTTHSPFFPLATCVHFAQWSVRQVTLCPCFQLCIWWPYFGSLKFSLVGNTPNIENWNIFQIRSCFTVCFAAFWGVCQFPSYYCAHWTPILPYVPQLGS